MSAERPSEAAGPNEHIGTVQYSHSPHREADVTGLFVCECIRAQCMYVCMCVSLRVCMCVSLRVCMCVSLSEPNTRENVWVPES